MTGTRSGIRSCRLGCDRPRHRRCWWALGSPAATGVFTHPPCLLSAHYQLGSTVWLPNSAVIVVRIRCRLVSHGWLAISSSCTDVDGCQDNVFFSLTWTEIREGADHTRPASCPHPSRYLFDLQNWERGGSWPKAWVRPQRRDSLRGHELWAAEATSEPGKLTRSKRSRSSRSIWRDDMTSPDTWQKILWEILLPSTLIVHC